MEKKKEKKKFLNSFTFTTLSLFVLFGFPQFAGASASLYLDSNTDEVNVGDEFEVFVLVDSGPDFINAIEANVVFDEDKLEVIDPTVGESLIRIWVAQPYFSNREGNISFQGAVPSPGIRIEDGVISKIKFRAKSEGNANLSFLGSSKVLLNDGFGTNVLSSFGELDISIRNKPVNIYDIESTTHPNPLDWYSNGEVSLSWSDPIFVSGYSYVFDRQADTIPDDIIDSSEPEFYMSNVDDGRYYFHLKALRRGVWGETSHYAINVDRSAPEDLTIDIKPDNFTINTEPLINFSAKDLTSGIDHFDIKLVALNDPSFLSSEDGELYIQATSPFAPKLKPGSYDVVVRAFDEAGNQSIATDRLEILPSTFGVAAAVGPPSLLMVLLLTLIAVGTIIFAFYHRSQHEFASRRIQEGILTDRRVSNRLERFEELKEEYGKKVTTLVIIAFFLFSPALSYAQDSSSEADMPAPLITNFLGSQNVGDYFYVAGRSQVKNAEVLINVTREGDGSNFSFSTPINEGGDWFYQHDEIFIPGKYFLTASLIKDGSQSVESEAKFFNVSESIASAGPFQVGTTALYLSIVMVLLAVIISFFFYGVFMFYQSKKKQKKIAREITEIESAVRRGLTFIKRDIENSLLEIKERGKLTDSKERAYKEKLENDLAVVQAELNQEIFGIRNLTS